MMYKDDNSFTKEQMEIIELCDEIDSQYTKARQGKTTDADIRRVVLANALVAHLIEEMLVNNDFDVNSDYLMQTAISSMANAIGVRWYHRRAQIKRKVAQKEGA